MEKHNIYLSTVLYNKEHFDTFEKLQVCHYCMKDELTIT